METFKGRFARDVKIKVTRDIVDEINYIFKRKTKDIPHCAEVLITEESIAKLLDKAFLFLGPADLWIDKKWLNRYLKNPRGSYEVYPAYEYGYDSDLPVLKAVLKCDAVLVNKYEEDFYMNRPEVV